MENIIVRALRNGADAIEEGYWYRGTRGRDTTEYGVMADGTVVKPLPGEQLQVEVGGGCLVTATKSSAAIEALTTFLGLRYEHEVFRLNDNQPLETGRQWAIDTLRACADAVEASEEVQV